MADIKQAIEYAKKNPTSAFATELRKRIESGKMNTELESSGLNTFTPTTPKEEQGYLGRVGSAYAQAGKDITSGIQQSAQDISQGMEQGGLAGVGQVLKGVARAGLRTVGGVAGATFAPITEAPVIKDTISAIGKGVASIIPTEVIQGASQLAQDNPEIAKDISNVVDIAGLGLGKVAESPLKAGLVTGAKKTAEVVGRGVSGIAPAIQTAKNLGTGVKDIAVLSAQGASRIPSRIATNVAEKKAIQESIKTLPTQSAQKAVQDGIDIGDAQFFSNIPKVQREPIKKLVQGVKDFESGASKVNPIEIVGKPISNRVTELKTARDLVGKKLGDISETLGVVTPKQTFTPVFTALQKTKGLEGISVNNKGILDFKNTVLASAETASDRKAIQSIFTNAVKSGTGKQKHLLRQELLESLGGKKKAGVQITGTQEQAYEAIRKGLSDTLDAINPEYKATNLEYAKIAQPLKDLANALKLPNEVDDEILNLSAGLLARRLTSNSATNPKIKSILNSLDKATKKAGTARTSTETLQDTLNILSKYYDIDQKTGFKNLVTEGVNKSGLTDFVGQAVGEVAGKTNAVRRKALEDMLDDLLSK